MQYAPLVLSKPMIYVLHVKIKILDLVLSFVDIACLNTDCIQVADI